MRREMCDELGGRSHLAVDEHAGRVAVEYVGDGRAAAELVDVLLRRVRVEDALEGEGAQAAARRHREHLGLLLAHLRGRGR